MAAVPELLPGPGQQIFRGSGLADGTDDDAGHQAVQQALVSAVERAFEEGFPELRHDRLHPVVMRRVLGSARELVARHRVTADETREGFRAASVVAAVEVERLAEIVRSARDDLAGRRLPRILVAVGAIEPADSDEAEIFRRTIEAEFARRGARLLDHAEASVGKAAADVLAALAGGDAPAAYGAGTDAGAEVVVAGSCGPGRWFFAALGEGGAALAVSEGEAPAIIEDAVKALERLAGSMAEDVLRDWSPPEGLTQVAVRIDGLDFEEFARLRRVIERMRGVAEVSAQPFSGEAGVYRVTFGGDAVELAQSLGGLDGFGLRVESVNAGAIRLTRGPRP